MQRLLAGKWNCSGGLQVLLDSVLLLDAFNFWDKTSVERVTPRLSFACIH